MCFDDDLTKSSMSLFLLVAAVSVALAGLVREAEDVRIASAQPNTSSLNTFLDKLAERNKTREMKWFKLEKDLAERNRSPSIVQCTNGGRLPIVPPKTCSSLRGRPECNGMAEVVLKRRTVTHGYHAQLKKAVYADPNYTESFLGTREPDDKNYDVMSPCEWQEGRGGKNVFRWRWGKCRSTRPLCQNRRDRQINFNELLFKLEQGEEYIIHNW